MKLEIYRRVLEFIRAGSCQKKAECLEELCDKYPEFHAETFHSIYSQELQRKIKHNIKKHRRSDVAQSYYERCMNHFDTSGKPGIILQIAEEADFPPVMIARIILGEYLKRAKFKESGTVPKGQVTFLLRNIQLIQDEKLAKEVEMCLKADEDCGPDNDALKRKIGEDYEKKLKDILNEKNIPFLDEDRLRHLGYDKTPDCRLEVPIAVDGYVVNWIESKASFGDEESHSSYLNDQFWSYTNRFGSGLVIYWFGFIDEFDNNKNREMALAITKELASKGKGFESENGQEWAKNYENAFASIREALYETDQWKDGATKNLKWLTFENGVVETQPKIHSLDFSSLITS